MAAVVAIEIEVPASCDGKGLQMDLFMSLAAILFRLHFLPPPPPPPPLLLLLLLPPAGSTLHLRVGAEPALGPKLL